MQKLSLPEYKLRIEKSDDKVRIFDPIRKKLVALTPEEWVRQNFLAYMVRDKGYPASLIAVEASLQVARRQKRTDVVVYSKQHKPLLIVECKAPNVKIDEAVFQQIVRYNMALQVAYLVVTNGLQHFCCTECTFEICFGSTWKGCYYSTVDLFVSRV